MPEKRVRVAISEQNQQLRVMQTALNDFLWTSEIAYGYAINTATAKYKDLDLTTPANEAFKDVATAAWHPTNQGRLKFNGTVGTLVDQVMKNTVHIYRAVIVFFAGSFEEYLKHRLADVGIKFKVGSYLTSLALPQLRNAPSPLPLHDVLCADICKKIRNGMAHQPMQIPTGSSVREALSHDFVRDWRVDLLSKAMSWDGGSVSTIGPIVDECFQRVIGRAIRGQQAAGKKEAKELPIELFYTLYNFTNLDTLGFRIEEALIPLGTLPAGRGERKDAGVNRRDLIVGDAE